MKLFRPSLRLFAALLLGLTGVLAFVLPETAEAAMTFCNRTENPIDAAFGYRDGEAWISQGWWKIEAGQCAKVMAEPLSQRFYFYFATSLVRPAKDKPPFVWSGKYQFCTDVKSFMIAGDGDCSSKGFQTSLFQEVDVGINTRDYVLDFQDGMTR